MSTLAAQERRRHRKIEERAIWIGAAALTSAILLGAMLPGAHRLATASSVEVTCGHDASGTPEACRTLPRSTGAATDMFLRRD